ncbi:MAG: DUF4338 domain-containing protein [Myxococcales bacterium]
MLRYRNRVIGEAELRFIRDTVDRQDARTRSDSARAICKAWDWRQANGSYAVFACQDLLLRLEEWGHIKLPARQRRCRDGHDLPVLPQDCIPLAWSPVGNDANLDQLVVRPIEPAERLGWRLFIDRFHYLGDKPLVGEHLLYAAFLEGQVVALLGWASATLHSPLRDRYLGWDNDTKRRKLHLVVNNVRFLIPPWVRVEHLASKVLGRTLRRLSADWQARWNHPVLLAETFVDHARFRGTCYRASNWRYLGTTAGRTRRGNAYLHEGSPKGLYVYELHRQARRRMCEEHRHEGVVGAAAAGAGDGPGQAGRPASESASDRCGGTLE